jgi:hypothetical protein
MNNVGLLQDHVDILVKNINVFASFDLYAEV